MPEHVREQREFLGTKLKPPLDAAGRQRFNVLGAWNAVTRELIWVANTTVAEELKIRLLFLPSYSPNLNLIERLWRFTKRRACYGTYHATFADFQAAIQAVHHQVPTKHADALASLMTLNFQEFEDVSLLAA